MAEKKVRHLYYDIYTYWPPNGNLASLRPIARFARLGYGNLEAIWQDVNLATNGLTSLATQAIWQRQFQRVNSIDAEK